jgi:hypothetical protein
MTPEGHKLRQKAVAGGTDSIDFPDDFAPLLSAFHQKTVDGQPIDPAIYEEKLVDASGAPRPISWDEWEKYWKRVAKGKAPGKSGITNDMIALAPPELQRNYLDHANVFLAGGPTPKEWKQEIIYPVAKVEGSIRIEQQRPITLLEAIREACSKIITQRLRQTWDMHEILSPGQQHRVRH